MVVVEDLEDYRLILQRVLEMDGHKVMTAADSRDGLDLIRRTKPDVAFIDLGLPGVDGFEIARTLRAEGDTSLLIALTAYGGDKNKRRALESGFDRHILKPMLPEERAEVLREARERCSRRMSPGSN